MTSKEKLEEVAILHGALESLYERLTILNNKWQLDETPDKLYAANITEIENEVKRIVKRLYEVLDGAATSH